MIYRKVDERDIRKLEQARCLVGEVLDRYYMGANGRELCGRLDTIVKKMTLLISDAREWDRTHDERGNMVV